METDPATPPTDDGQAEVTPASPPLVDTGKTAENADELKLELERTRLALKNANKEAADRRKKLEAYEAAEKERELASLSELEKAQKDAADSKARIETVEKEKADITAKAADKLLRAAVLVEAGQQGFQDPADAWLYVDRSQIKAKDDDTFEGLDKAVKTVLEAKPYLAKAAQRPSIGTPRGGLLPLNGQGKVEAAAVKKVRL